MIVSPKLPSFFILEVVIAAAILGLFLLPIFGLISENLVVEYQTGELEKAVLDAQNDFDRCIAGITLQGQVLSVPVGPYKLIQKRLPDGENIELLCP